ncbi:DegT/DnrJ/EryC1/StrS aminotransferase family protein [Anaerocolumna aminovalerica]|uniref:DegT/DnrJ/EryC1/StrS aminotransferase family protein n=1 Tax=Anaerocolumna aminovalerica TaxID=1527 RepID=UPI000BE3E8C8|nr:DegT/DnrJ/EryC1/StrS aminotransferase family protein [Anaerocolumna aminovalerica]
MEIGSEFWLDDPSAEQKMEAQWIRKFGNTVLTTSGRGAISLLLQEVNPRFKSVLLPAYICDSLILPFRKNGYQCSFYDINKDLSPITETIRENREVGIFLHMGYFGFSTNNNLMEVIREFKRNSAIIIEDVTQTLFSDFKRYEENDYYVASVRKWMGLPSGGLLASPVREIKGTLPEDKSFASIRKEALLLKAEYIHKKDELLKKQYLNLFSHGERILSEEPYPYRIDSLSNNIMNGTDVNKLVEIRKNNYQILKKGLNGIEFIEPVFQNVPGNTCPMFYPVYLNNNRDQIREKLSSRKIYCPIHWSRPKQISVNSFKNIGNIYNRILSIPCDQRYDWRDMDRVISVLGELENDRSLIKGSE